MKYLKRGTIEFLIHYWERDYKKYRWEPYYAWRPVKDVYGKWHWRTRLYRMHANTYVDHDDWMWHFYMTENDLSLFMLRWL